MAYMDDLLEPADAEALGKRIEQSEFASTLMHRIREVMRRLRLGAPDIDDRRAGLDPNTVAEYLDHTLPPDQIPDFEKVCLDSDLHLAEVASCHQILSLVLGEPAEVDPASRQRMYHIPQVETERAVAAVGETSGEAGKDGDHVGHRKHAIPEYLREPPPRRRWQPVLAVTLLAIFFAAVVLAAMGQFNSEGTLARLVGVGPAASPPANGADSAALADPDAVVPAPVDERPEGELPSEDPVPEAPPPGEEEPPGEVPADTEPAVDEAAEEAVPPMARPSAGVDQPEEVRPDEPDAAADEAAAPLPPQPVAHFVSQRDLLLKVEPQNGAWQWVIPGEELIGPTTLLSLPSFYPVLSMGGGVTLQGAEEARFTLGPVDADGMTTLRIDFGRLVLRKRGAGDTALRLEVSGATGTLDLPGPESVVAFEVWHRIIPGAEPAPAARLSIHLLSGDGRWTAAKTAEPIELAAPELLVVEGARSEEVAASVEPPPWLVGEPANPLERRAAETVLSLIDPPRTPRINFRELLQHRMREVRSLAFGCLGVMGDFTDQAALLNQAEERGAWDDHLEQMQRALARGPQAAEALQAAFVRHYGEEDGTRMFRWLHGFTAEGLREGEAEALVEALNREPLAVRVVGFFSLRALTGRGLFYRPADPPADRRRFVQTWQDRVRREPIWELAAELGTLGPPTLERRADPAPFAP